ncbi:MAG: hypothetical protein CME88_17160 [Hirschia sp.]|nr:hypothetical protein [Hirschia sp.]|tara:strand:- start:892 stop:1374 length:483 start_codon:yes stop_codon:yes gene_type:complete
MKTFLSVLALTAAFAAPVYAQEITTTFSEDFTEKLNDDFGVREGEFLTKRLETKVRRELEGTTSDVASVALVIEDARPNRPTFQQMSDKPGLDPIRSKSIGGAKITGEAFDANGDLIAEVSYKWYENDITMINAGGTWSDANRAFGRFADRLHDEIQANE